MSIDKEFLEKEIASLKAQQQQHFRIFAQAEGALAVLEVLLTKVNEAPPPPNVPVETEADPA